MSLSVDQLGKAIVASGLMSAGDLKTLWAELPAGTRPKDGDTFTKLLIEREKLSEFQAAELLSGSNTPLILNQYVLLSKIGAGGMGQVFKAQHRKMKRLAAIKLLPSALVQDEAAVKRFQREVEAAAKLSHPNIVQTYDADECRGIHYLAMEYVEGQDLAVLAKQRGNLPVVEVVNYMIQAARGLAFAHENGVVHRDIKPANLLLDKKGMVKILDMGLARVDGAAATAAKDGLTQSGEVMGTVDYMAPEQAFNTKNADARADIYSLGCSLYRLLTGKNMYDGESIVEKLMGHQQLPIPSLAALRPDVPKPLVAVFERMVAKKPRDRYQTMAEVETALAALTNLDSAAGSAQTSGAGGLFASFFKSRTDPKPAATPGSVTTLDQPSAPAAESGDLSATTAFDKAQHTTDPVSQRSIAAASVASVVPTVAPPARPQKPAGSGGGNRKRLTAAGLGGALLVLLGVWVIIKNKDGKEVARVQIPDGGEVTVQTVPEDPAVKESQASGTNALEFDGNGIVKLDATPDLNLKEITVEAWVTATGPGKYSWAGGQRVANYGHVFRNLASTNVLALQCMSRSDGTKEWMIAVKNNKSEIVGLSSPNMEWGQMTHVAGMFDGKQLTLFINGRKEGTPTPVDNFGSIKLFPSFLAGSEGNGGTPNFVGRIHGFRLSNKVRYTSEFQPPPQFTADKETVALYLFNEGQGDVLNDSSGNGYHGKIIGAKWVKGEGPAASLPAPLAAPSAAGPTAPRWPLAPSKPEDIAWLQGMKARLTLRTGSDKDVVLKPTAAPPAGPATIVGLNFGRDNGPSVTDDVLKRTATLVDLESLVVNFASPGSPATKDGMQHLTALKNLRSLELGRMGPKGTDPGFLESFSKLESLSLAYFIIQKWEPCVARLLSLEEFSLYGSEDAKLEQIGPLPRLRTVTLSGYGGEHATKRLEMAKRLHAVAPWCRVIIHDQKQPEMYIEPTAPLPGAATVALGNSPPPAKAPFDVAQAKAHQEVWAKHLGTTVETVNSVGAKMVLIPPGEFQMGSSDEQVAVALKMAEETGAGQNVKDRIQKAEQPQHKVVIAKPFLMGATEVTIGQFKKFAAATGFQTEAEKARQPANYLKPGYAVTDDSPAARITWNDAVAYCQWLSSQEKTTYRLPSEAEWECACRAGTTTQFSFGDDATLLDQFGWYQKNSAEKTHPVNTKLPNAFGLHDMHGNVIEWCGDVYDEKWYEKAKPNDLSGPPAGLNRVLRGGFFNYGTLDCRAAFRGYFSPSHLDNHVGFRVIRELASSPSLAPTADRYALKFDGEKDLVAVPDFNFDGNPPLTIEGWITPVRVDQGGIKVIEVGDTGTPHFSLKYNGTEYHCNFSISGPPIDWQMAKVLISKEANRRDHVAVIWDGKSIQCFVNGKIGETTKLKPSLATQRPTGGMTIGFRNSRGLVAEVRISKSVRYRQDFTPEARFATDSDTLALYHFDEGQGDQLVDSSGNGRHGTISGAKWVRADGTTLTSTPTSKAPPPVAKAPFDAATAKKHQEAWAKYLGTKVETTNSIGVRMTLIPPGEFMMGSTREQFALVEKMLEDFRVDPKSMQNTRYDTESPSHRVVLTKPFLLGTYEVTVGEFKKFIAATNYVTLFDQEANDSSDPKKQEGAKKGTRWGNPGYPVTDNHPVPKVHWADSFEFCNWLSKQEQLTPWYSFDGKGNWQVAAAANGYRLPTEAEWEYACRAGTTTLYSFGDDYAELDKYGWFALNSQRSAYPVGSKLPNPFGLFDMHGNVFEWCQDKIDMNYYHRSPQTDPTGPKNTLEIKGLLTSRGGCWAFNQDTCRSAFRSYTNYTGFRVVRPLDATKPETKLATTANPPVLPITPTKPWNTRPFQTWMKEIQAMPAEDQIKAVSKKLVELNPGFDGNVKGKDGKSTPTIENGVVTEMSFLTDNVSDISPVRALVGLQALWCSGKAGKSKLSDLSPLQGMDLRVLFCFGTQVSDLSPLQGMKLTGLYCTGTRVANLSPLQGMPLTVLTLRGSLVTDLSPLSSMSTLDSLTLNGSPVAPASIATLQQALPNCKIEWDDPAQGAATPPNKP